jgi:hypothetical protein
MYLVDKGLLLLLLILMDNNILSHNYCLKSQLKLSHLCSILQVLVYTMKGLQQPKLHCKFL